MLIGAAVGPAPLEGSTFTATSPSGPTSRRHAPRTVRADSWSGRLTAARVERRGGQGSYAYVHLARAPAGRGPGRGEMEPGRAVGGARGQPPGLWPAGMGSDLRGRLASSCSVACSPKVHGPGPHRLHYRFEQPSAPKRNGSAVPLASPPPRELDPGHHPPDGVYRRLRPSGWRAPGSGPPPSCRWAASTWRTGRSRSIAVLRRLIAGGAGRWVSSIRGGAPMASGMGAPTPAAATDVEDGYHQQHGTGLPIGHARPAAAARVAASPPPAACCGAPDDGTGPTAASAFNDFSHYGRGRQNVPDRFTSDLWVYGNHAYICTRPPEPRTIGIRSYIWSLDAGGAPHPGRLGRARQASAKP